MSVLVNGQELFCLCGNKKEMDSQFMRYSIKLTIHFFD